MSAHLTVYAMAAVAEQPMLARRSGRMRCLTEAEAVTQASGGPAPVTWRRAALLAAIGLALALGTGVAPAAAEEPTVEPVTPVAEGQPPDEVPSPVDSDNDGLFDDEEERAGLDPFDPDTDGDLLSDGEEVFGHWWGYVTDPTRWDTDGDGWGDSTEVRLFLTDPLVPNDI